MDPRHNRPCKATLKLGLTIDLSYKPGAVGTHLIPNDDPEFDIVIKGITFLDNSERRITNAVVDAILRDLENNDGPLYDELLSYLGL